MKPLADEIRPSEIQETHEPAAREPSLASAPPRARPGPRPAARLRILVSDAYYKHTLAVVRGLGRAGHRVTVLATSPGDLAVRSRYCAGVEYLSPAGSQNLALAVAEILRRNPQDVVIPVGYATTVALARERETLRSLSRLEIAEYEQIRFAADKERVRELAMQLGIPVPVTMYPSSKRDLFDCADSLGFPLILKVRTESAGMSVRLVKTREMLYPAFDQLSRPANCAGGARLMIQEFIPGHGCGFFALYGRGVCKRVFMHRRVREYPAEGGISCCAESFYDPQLKELSLRLLDAMQWHGVAMVEYRFDERDGKFKLLEINPKFWGSLDLALAAGADFPGDLCRMAMGEPLEYCEAYDRGTRFHWPLSGDLQHVLSRPASAAGVLADWLNPRVKSNLWISDPGPAWVEMRSFVQSGWRRFSRE